MLKENAYKKYFDDLHGEFSVSYTESEKAPLHTVHVHDAFEITFILSDNVSLEVNEEKYDLPEGTLLLFNTMDLHRIYTRNDTGYRRFVLWFKYDFLRELEPVREELLKCFYNRAFEKANVVQLTEQQSMEVKKICRRMEEVHKGLGECGALEKQSALLLVKFLLGQILITVNEIYLEQHPFSDARVTNDQQRVYQVIRYIQEHLAEKLDRCKLAAMAYMDIRNFNNHIRTITGMTIGQYILNCRLTVAKSYLAQGLSVTEVCEKAGFGDVSNFSRTFHKHIGMSPKQYAMRNKQL